MTAKKAETTKKTRGAKANRQIKSTMFSTLFGEVKNAIELANALIGTNYGADTKVEVTTLQNTFLSGVVNDMSILLDNVLLVLIEHQSTICGNMPLRMLEYVTKTYTGFITKKDVYSGRKIELPRPVFIVLYNGTAKMGDREFHRLSDSYTKALPVFTDMGGLELGVTVINVNDPRNKKLVKTCKLLDGYCIFNNALNRNTKTMDLLAAINKTIDDCIARGVLTDFLEKHRKELTTMLFEGLDTKTTLKIHGEEKYKEGRAEGLTKGLTKGLKKGRAEGRAEGLKKGRVEGRAEGRAEGIGIWKKNQRDTAIALKREGVSVDIISRSTKLSVSTIRRLLAQRN